MIGDHEKVARLRKLLSGGSELELAVLVGSRATGDARTDSDWDIAIQWEAALSLFDTLSRTETLRRELAKGLGVAEECIDLIDLPRARLAMRAVIAENGVPLKGEDSLAWNHFLARTWRELEDFQWDQARAA